MHVSVTCHASKYFYRNEMGQESTELYMNARTHVHTETHKHDTPACYVCMNV